MGSFEYLVYFNAFEGVAAQFGLKLVTDYGDPAMDRLFEQVCTVCVCAHSMLVVVCSWGGVGKLVCG